VTGFAIVGAVLVAGLRGGDPPSLNGAPVQPPVSAPFLGGDTLAADLLARIRGLDPVACELAARALRWQNTWGGAADPAASDDPRVGAIVRWALDAGGPEAIPVLAEGIRDPDPCVRRVAAMRLGRIETPAAAERLRRALESTNPAEREAGALGIGVAEDAASIPALVEALGRDESPRVRRMAAWALGEIE